MSLELDIKTLDYIHTKVSEMITKNAKEHPTSIGTYDSYGSYDHAFRTVLGLLSREIEHQKENKK